MEENSFLCYNLIRWFIKQERSIWGGIDTGSQLSYTPRCGKVCFFDFDC